MAVLVSGRGTASRTTLCRLLRICTEDGGIFGPVLRVDLRADCFVLAMLTEWDAWVVSHAPVRSHHIACTELLQGGMVSRSRSTPPPPVNVVPHPPMTSIVILEPSDMSDHRLASPSPSPQKCIITDSAFITWGHSTVRLDIMLFARRGLSRVGYGCRGNGAAIMQATSGHGEFVLKCICTTWWVCPWSHESCIFNPVMHLSLMAGVTAGFPWTE